MSIAVSLGIIAGLLQALGYILYVFMTIKRELRPNASTWFMFAYGTTLLTVLELEQGASVTLLILPITCAVLGVCVAFMCWYRGTLHWPENKIDRASFIADVALTFGYLGAWSLNHYGVLSTSQAWFATLAFLVASNLTAVSSFLPLLREAHEAPAHERFEPWLVWAAAYAVLGLTTFLTEGLWSSLMLYPAINAPLHATVAWLARPARKQRMAVMASAN